MATDRNASLFIASIVVTRDVSVGWLSWHNGRHTGDAAEGGCVEGSQRAYDHLIVLIEERLPDIAVQIREEVARGRTLSASRIPDAERRTRQVRLDEVSLGRIGKADVAAEPYSSDEQLTVLVDALRTLAVSMAGSRQTVSDLVTDRVRGASAIDFVDPAGDQIVTSFRRAELADIKGRLAEATAELAEALDEVRPRQ